VAQPSPEKPVVGCRQREKAELCYQQSRSGLDVADTQSAIAALGTIDQERLDHWTRVHGHANHPLTWHKRKINMNQVVDANQMRSRIGQIARGMLDGSVQYLEGSIELASLRHDVGAYENDPDFMPFVAVLSRIDSLEIDTSRQQWSKGVTPGDELEIQKAVEWAKEFSLSQCKSLAKRFGTR
jgi:hypothetical protein